MLTDFSFLSSLITHFLKAKVKFNRFNISILNTYSVNIFVLTKTVNRIVNVFNDFHWF